MGLKGLRLDKNLSFNFGKIWFGERGKEEIKENNTLEKLRCI